VFEKALADFYDQLTALEEAFFGLAVEAEDETAAPIGGQTPGDGGTAMGWQAYVIELDESRLVTLDEGAFADLSRL
jgi:hypothetical protein